MFCYCLRGMVSLVKAKHPEKFIVDRFKADFGFVCAVCCYLPLVPLVKAIVKINGFVRFSQDVDAVFVHHR